MLFDFGTGDPREPTDPKIRHALHRRRPRGQQVPEHGRQGRAPRGLLRLDGAPPRGRRSTPRARSCRPRAPRRRSSTPPWPSCTPPTRGAASPTARQATRSTNGAPLFAGGEALPVRAEMRRRVPAAARRDRPRTHADTLDQLPPQPHRRDRDVRVPGGAWSSSAASTTSCSSPTSATTTSTPASPPPSILEVTRERTLAFCSLSKRSGMTGYRSAMMAGDPELIAALKKLRPSIGVATQAFVQDAATAAWRDDAHVEKRRRIFGEKRALFTAFFERSRPRIPAHRRELLPVGRGARSGTTRLTPCG